MATAPLLEEISETGTDIAVVVTNNPGVVLLDRVKFDAWYDRLSSEAPKDVDITTTKGRDKLRSYAAKVRSEKATIEKARLALTEEWRNLTSQANAAGKEIKDRLENLAVEVRKPLTDWEDAENARLSACRDIITQIKAAVLVTEMDTAETVRARGTEIWTMKLEADQFGDLLPEAQAAKEQTVATLKAALTRLEKEEADRADLERLRAEAAAREEADRVAREAQEAADQEAEQARLAEEARVAAEEAEAARIESVRKEAEETARRAAAEAAQAERDRIQREHDEAIAAERARAEEAEAAAKAERDRIAAAEEARQAEEKRLADEQAAREADQKHRRAVKTAAKEAIMSCGVTEDAAQKVVLAIIAGEVPAVTLRF